MSHCGTFPFCYYPGRVFSFITDQVEQTVKVTLISGDAAYQSKSSNTGFFTLESDSAVFRIEIGSVVRTLVLVPGSPHRRHHEARPAGRGR